MNLWLLLPAGSMHTDASMDLRQHSTLAIVTITFYDAMLAL
jgi:hypothetical protein